MARFGSSSVIHKDERGGRVARLAKRGESHYALHLFRLVPHPNLLARGGGAAQKNEFFLLHHNGH